VAVESSPQGNRQSEKTTETKAQGNTSGSRMLKGRGPKPASLSKPSQLTGKVSRHHEQGFSKFQFNVMECWMSCLQLLLHSEIKYALEILHVHYVHPFDMKSGPWWVIVAEYQESRSTEEEMKSPALHSQVREELQIFHACGRKRKMWEDQVWVSRGLSYRFRTAEVCEWKTRFFLCT